MSKLNNSKFKIIFLFIISMFLFALLIGCGTVNHAMEIAKNDNIEGGPFIACGVFIMAQATYFLFIGLIAIIVRFINIDESSKRLIYYLPGASLLLFIPVSILAMYFCSLFNLFGFK